MTNVVKVCFQDRECPERFSMQAYTYRTAIPLQRNDLVIAPTKHGDRVARVHEVNVPESAINPKWETRTIEKTYEDYRNTEVADVRNKIVQDLKEETIRRKAKMMKVEDL